MGLRGSYPRPTLSPMASIEWRYKKRLGTYVAVIRWWEGGKHRSRHTKIPKSHAHLAQIEADRIEASSGALRGRGEIMALAFIDSMKTQADATVTYYHQKVSQLIGWLPDRIEDWDRPSIITAVQAYVDSSAPRSGQMMRQVTLRFLRWLNERGAALDIPTPSDFEIASPPSRLPEFISRKKVKRVLKECRGTLRTAALLTADAGLRRTEVIDLDWSCVGKKRIKVLSPKTLRERSIPMTKRLRKHLEPLRGEGDVAPGMSRGSVYRDLRAAYDRAGVRYPTRRPWYVFRHSFITRLLDKGVPLNVVMDLSGHTNLKTTSRYAHSVSSQQEDAIAQL